jgi:hypothetical protein
MPGVKVSIAHIGAQKESLKSIFDGKDQTFSSPRKVWNTHNNVSTATLWNWPATFSNLFADALVASSSSYHSTTCPK